MPGSTLLIFHAHDLARSWRQGKLRIMVTVNNAQKYRDSITDSAESSRPAQWDALNLPFAESQSVKRTATVTAS